MPVRATKRGAERTPLNGAYDVLICGASFAGLAVARELRGSGARRARDRPLRDRRAPDLRLRGADGVAGEPRPETAIRQTFGDLVIHRPTRSYRWRLPWTFSTFDYRHAVRAAARPGRRFRSRPRRSTGRTRAAPSTPTAATCARRSSSTRSAGAACCRTPSAAIQPPEARLSRGLEVHPHGRRRRPRAVARPEATCARATRGASRPATSCASASARSTRATTSRSRPCGWPTTSTSPPARYQGNWIPHRLRRRGRGRRLLRRRQRRPLPADDRRGHPHRAVLRPGLRARAARRRRGPPDARAGAGALRRVLRRARSRRSTGCCACRASSRA